MSLRELIELNSLVFGASKPVIRAFYNCKDGNPYWLNDSMYENQFIYTGVQNSMLVINLTKYDVYYYYFDSYCNLADVEKWFSSVIGEKLKDVDSLFVRQNRIISVVDLLNGTTTEDKVVDVASFCRFYLVEYYQTRLMLMNI